MYCNYCHAHIVPGYTWSHDDMVRDGWTHFSFAPSDHAPVLTPYDIARGVV